VDAFFVLDTLITLFLIPLTIFPTSWFIQPIFRCIFEISTSFAFY